MSARVDTPLGHAEKKKRRVVQYRVNYFRESASAVQFPREDIFHERVSNAYPSLVQPVTFPAAGLKRRGLLLHGTSSRAIKGWNDILP